MFLSITELSWSHKVVLFSGSSRFLPGFGIPVPELCDGRCEDTEVPRESCMTAAFDCGRQLSDAQTSHRGNDVSQV